MKRDMELVRKILLSLEDRNDTEHYLNIDGYSSEAVGYHCFMLYEYGLIRNFKAQSADNNPYYIFFVSGLTWEGYDFLEKVRDDGTWQKTVRMITEKGLDTSIKTIGAIATAIITAATEGTVSAIIKNGGQN